MEELLDEVSCLGAGPVGFALGVAIASRRDDRLGTAGLDDADQGRTLRDIGHLAGHQDQTNRIAQGIDTSMNLSAQPTPRAIA